MTANSASLASSLASPPFREATHVVCPDEVEQLRVWKKPRVIPDRINREGNTAALDLLIIDFAVGFAREREPEQLHPDGGGRELIVGLEGGLRRENEE